MVFVLGSWVNCSRWKVVKDRLLLGSPDPGNVFGSSLSLALSLHWEDAAEPRRASEKEGGGKRGACRNQLLQEITSRQSQGHGLWLGMLKNGDVCG